MVSLPFFNRRFTFNWQMMAAAVLAILLFVFLGWWQLCRAAEKKEILVAQAKMERQKPVLWAGDDPLPRPYQPIRAVGTFLPMVLLLDNQHHQHRFGYNVISPLVLKQGAVILVDRGWVPGEPTRQTFPKVDVPQGDVGVSGVVYFPSSKNVTLGELIEKKGANLTIIERLEIKKIHQFLHNSVYPFIIRLDKHEANGFVREWAAVSMPPQRHYAYALQWFIFALVALIVFISLSLKEK